jgi:hypothetical protein
VGCSSKTVLIVDDSKLARISLTAAIRRNKPEWQVLEATT